VLLKEEYYRDPYERFGPPRLCSRPRVLLPRLQTRANFLRINIPIFIPAIEDHLNAQLDQARAEKDSGLKNGGARALQIRNFVRYLYLDSAPNRDWILDAKVHDHNRELMRSSFDKFRRKLLILWDPVLGEYFFDKMRWELSISDKPVQN
jgi:hypothetical protein